MKRKVHTSKVPQKQQLTKSTDDRIEEMLKPSKMLAVYKRTLKDQTPFWKKQRRDRKFRNMLPSDRMYEAQLFREQYRMPKGLVAEMYRQATDESTL